MTAIRGGWGVLLSRRQEGLSKMMAYSIFLHLFLFLSIILNRTFFSSRTASFDGFQVNLVAPGAGGGAGDLAPPRVAKKTKKATTKKSAKARTKAPPVVKKTSPKSAAPKAVKARAAVKPAPVSPKSEPKAVPSLTRAPRRSVNAPPPEKEDPERLQEWWKKQKKALKTPSATPGIKPKMGVSERKRTAKIDIQKRPVLVPPVVSPPTLAPKTAPQAALSPDKNIPEKQVSRETETPEKTNDPFSSEEDEAGNLTTEASEEGSPSDDGASLQASLGPGITGIGPGSGGASFQFPNYLQKVDHKIRWRWAPPPVASAGDRLVIRFVIQKSGGIDKSSVEITESSGNLFFDQAAIRAIYAAHPLPPLPKAYGENVLIVFMNFVVREDS